MFMLASLLASSLLIGVLKLVRGHVDATKEQEGIVKSYIAVPVDELGKLGTPSFDSCNKFDDASIRVPLSFLLLFLIALLPHI